MFSYRHSFHAGNYADVLKHITLVAILRYLISAKDTPLLLVDTHAGAGLYRLDGADAQTSQEAMAAILPLWQQYYGAAAAAKAQAPEALAAYLQVLESFNTGGGLRKYPGSPLIAASLLRTQDQMRVFELHPTDGRLLHNNMIEWQKSMPNQAARVQVVRNNGFAGLKALLPPPRRRALVLMDPSYELKTDYGQVITCMQDALQRFATGCYMVWYPIIPRPEAHDLPRRLKTLAQKAGKGWLHATLTVKSSKMTALQDKRPGLPASGMFVINPPYTLRAALQPALVQMQALLGQDRHAAHTLEVSGG